MAIETIQLNNDFIESYATEVADILVDDFFSKKELIDGNDVVDFCSLSQVNFFVLKVLFEEWKTELETLKQPYFDYQNDEVKNVMNDLAIVLSHHIQMKRDHFYPLLKNAIKSSINLTFNPLKFLNNYCKGLSDLEQLTVRNIKSHAKYIKLHKVLIVSLIRKFDGWYGDTSINIERIYEINYSILEEHGDKLKPAESILKKLFDIKPASLDDFLLKKGEKPTSTNTAKEDYSVPAAAGNAKPDIVKTTPASPSKETPKKEKEEVREKQETKTADKPVVEKATVVTEIRSSISINQRFNFVNELFKGEFDTFDEAIDKLEQCSDFDSASIVLVENYVEKYEWDTETKEVQDFFEIVAKKF
ncbi:MAG: hypothetical protein AB8B61_03705 [Cyclobacteriaceae bacterium]